MRCLIISAERMRPEARELVLHALGEVVTDWIEIRPQIGEIAKYLRQADFVFVGGTNDISLKVIGYLVNNAHLPVIIVTTLVDEIQELAKGHKNVVLVPSLTVVDSERNMLSTRVSTAFHNAKRAALPYAIVFEGEFEPHLLSSPINLAGAIQPWFTMGWRKGRLIVWHGIVMEIVQDVTVPYGDYSPRVIFCREHPGLHQAQKDSNLIEVFEEKWEL